MAGTGTDHRNLSKASVYEDVKDYYGNILKKSSDLNTNACVTPTKPIPAYVRKALGDVHPDVSSRYYGCGLVVPECLEGCRLLDLGCGTGRDCYMLSQLVGEKGHVTGIDMTDYQLEVARKYVDYHMQKFGYKKPNVNFVHGYIETLEQAGLEEGYYDIIISNCVVNLSPDKASVLKEAYRVLKEGGELYFSDIYSSARVSEELRAHKVLWGECLSGALWWEDLMQLAADVGFSPPRLVTASPVTVGNKELEKLLGDYKFVSATYRLFKLPKSSDKGRSLVVYDGNITGCEDKLEFDVQYTFKANEVMEVDGEVAHILRSSRFAGELTFQPEGKTTSGVCCAKPKVVSMNPFELAEQQENATQKPATGGCCGAQKSCCN
ncbi:arsenite methyltransferase [Chanos chanos]|uniref:Arsenite methyltransferase n=1 Tax=Chanos chanos TaxID=29144 RepID=A0A6J2VYV5_CHACN|nr:arsenite methyltransferase [Chanos chanos]